MNKTVVLVLGVLAMVSCLDVENRPILSMTGTANSPALTTEDTLIIVRAITNGGQNDVWLDATADAFEMTNASGAEVCDPSAILALSVPQVVRVPAGNGIVDERKFALEDLPNCAPGNYILSFVAHFRDSETSANNFTLRTSSSAFTVVAP